MFTLYSDCRPDFLCPGVKANVLFFDRKPAAEKPWTEKLWIYDLRTNNTSPQRKSAQRSDLGDFVACYTPKNRHERKESDRFKSFTYEELPSATSSTSTSSGSKTKASKTAPISPIPMLSLRRSSKTWKRPFHNSRTIASDLKK